jgi:choline kinase
MQQLPVIYLAAGKGSRLGELCADRPKALVEAGGVPLADRAFEYLSAAGFERIVAVTGHAHEKLDAYAEIETVFNPKWATENNITSLWQVRDIVTDGCVIVNCDLLFEPELAQRLAEAEGTAILVDDHLAVDDESMKATEEGGALDRLHKSLDHDASVGEYIGLTRIDPQDGPRLKEILEDFIAAGNVQVYYEDAIEALGNDRPVRLERIGGLLWVEIDDHDDLAKANTEIAPAIAERVAA